MILSDKECLIAANYNCALGTVRAIESAILSKLNSAEPVAVIITTGQGDQLDWDTDGWDQKWPSVPLYLHPPAPSAEHEVVKLLERASISIGEFVSDQGWAQSDMDTMDSIDAYLFRLNAKKGEK